MRCVVTNHTHRFVTNHACVCASQHFGILGKLRMQTCSIASRSGGDPSALEPFCFNAGRSTMRLNLTGNFLAGISESLLGLPTMSSGAIFPLPINWKRIACIVQHDTVGRKVANTLVYSMLCSEVGDHHFLRTHNQRKSERVRESQRESERERESHRPCTFRS